MEALRAIASRVGTTTTTGHSPSRLLRGAARAMWAASTHGIDCGGSLPRDFSIVVAVTAPSAFAETSTPPTSTSLLSLILAPSGKLVTADGIIAPPPSSSTAERLSLFWGRHPRADSPTTRASIEGPRCFFTGSKKATRCSFRGSCNSLLRGLSSGANPLCLPPWTTRRCASYSMSSGQSIGDAKAEDGEETPVLYVVGMFDDINAPKWTPHEFAGEHVPLQSVQLVGDQMLKNYTVLTELAKDWFVSLPLLIEKLKRHGYSFYKPVSIPQLMVDRHGHFVIADGTLLRKTSKRYVSKDYFSSADVFEEIIKCSCGYVVLPASFKDFLKKLRSKQDLHGYYFCVHPSFLLLPVMSQAYLDVYDHVKERLSEKDGKKIWMSLTRSAQDWNRTMEGNVLLVAWFDDPDNKNHDREQERYIIGYGKHLFRYLRHVHSHLLAYVKLIEEGFSKDDARLMIECKFGYVMSSLYSKLWQYHLLIDIESEAYFCRPGGTCCPTPGFCLRRDIRLNIKENQRRLKLQKEKEKDQAQNNITQAPHSQD